LVRVRDQKVVWSDEYDIEPTRIVHAQQELSAAIAQQVSLSLSPQHRSALERRHTRNGEALTLYLSGAASSMQRTPAANQDAIDYYQRAIELDNNYALAWSGIALTYSASTINSGDAPRDVAQYAEDAARRAVTLAPELAEARLALGHVSWLLLWDWRAAEDEFRKAVDLDPNSAQAQYLLGHVLSQGRRHREARQLMDRARALDFNDPMMHAMSAQVAFQARDYDAALKHGQQATLIAGDFWIGHIQVAQAQQERGESELALDALGKDRRDNGSLALKGYIFAKQDRKSKAHDVLNELAAVAKDRYVPPSHMALVHAGLGDRKAVFEWLDKAFEARDVHLIFLPVDPKWDPYRTDPLFQELLARCGFTDNE
jgi:tetratricopeptide (TPR) repeat protein